MSVDDTDGKAVRYMNDMAHSFISEFVKNARVYSGTDYKFPFLFERPSVSKSKMCCVQYKWFINNKSITVTADLTIPN
jgi:hypothetical protein